ncbi:MAG TPA: hypothetical protein VGI90_07705 [Steroidobacteraceae bacterium]
MQRKERGILAAILLGGVIAATIDVVAASIISGRTPAFILQAIAAGLLGKASFGGGVPTMILGAFLQEAMGILIAAIYVLPARAMPALSRRWVVSGLAYGAIIFFVMNYAVVPLSALKATPHFTALKFAENMAAMLLFGLIVAFFYARASVSAEPARNEAIVPA